MKLLKKDSVPVRELKKGIISRRALIFVISNNARIEPEAWPTETVKKAIRKYGNEINALLRAIKTLQNHRNGKRAK